LTDGFVAPHSLTGVPGLLNGDGKGPRYVIPINPCKLHLVPILVFLEHHDSPICVWTKNGLSR